MYVGGCLLLHGADVSNPSVNYSEMTAALGTVPHEKLGEVKGATPGLQTVLTMPIKAAVLTLAHHELEHRPVHRHAIAHTRHING